MQYHQTTSIRAWLPFFVIALVTICLLYPSDAADE